MCGIAAAPCYVTGGIYQFLYKRCSVRSKLELFHTSVSHGLTGDRKEKQQQQRG